ncbi:hypothetical protein B0H19DRAFT_1266897 [Mycena capillaripes]|nr:hypothetical protein B0H19DRAFT_1266897 [Mycena capillaripes]
MVPTASPAHLSSIANFANEAFVGTAINPDDDAAEAALATHYAPHVRVTEVETTTTADLSRGDFQAFIQTLRTQLTDRKLLSATFVLATPADTTNRTGAVAATHVLTAMQGGVDVTVTIVALLRIVWVAKPEHEQGGSRKIVTDAILMNIVNSSS